MSWKQTEILCGSAPGTLCELGGVFISSRHKILPRGVFLRLLDDQSGFCTGSSFCTICWQMSAIPCVLAVLSLVTEQALPDLSLAMGRKELP